MPKNHNSSSNYILQKEYSALGRQQKAGYITLQSSNYMGSLLFHHWIQPWSWTCLEMCKLSLNGKHLHWEADSPFPNSSIIFRSAAVSRVLARLRCWRLSRHRTAPASYHATTGKGLSPASLDLLQRGTEGKWATCMCCDAIACGNSPCIFGMVLQKLNQVITFILIQLFLIILRSLLKERHENNAIPLVQTVGKGV